MRPPVQSATVYTKANPASTSGSGHLRATVSNTKSDNILHLLTVLIIGGSLVAAGTGVFSNTTGAAHTIHNLYGDVITLYGKGLYANDSYFRAPIFRGTDVTMLFVACPLLIVALWLDRFQPSIRSRLLLISVISCFTYYAASLALGVQYNYLHLLYIALFSLSLFTLIKGINTIQSYTLEKSVRSSLPYKGIAVFLWLTGVALLVAWLPDIGQAMAAGRGLAMIEHYTTEITYVLDMGVIAPACLFCLYYLKQRKGFGYVLLSILLTLCVLIGMMLPVQTFYQWQAGIVLPVGVLVTKVASFCLLAAFAFYFQLRLLKSIHNAAIV